MEASTEEIVFCCKAYCSYELRAKKIDDRLEINVARYSCYGLPFTEESNESDVTRAL